ncbi:MAG: hypothetical protein ACI8X5_001627 [Planctomycetota bacterium]|jgi:hypothetical protein
MQWQVREVLKSDSFGRVEELESDSGLALIRRVACGASIPGSRLIARYLMGRERAALCALGALDGVPLLSESEAAMEASSSGGRAPLRKDVLVRECVLGKALHQTELLAEDFFDHLDALVAELHALGVCHNDLHKEMNVMVGEDRFPYLIDFQLASLHPRRGRVFASRVQDDLRHIQKHRRRYTRDGRGPLSASALHGVGHGVKRRGLARIWRRTGKPLYNFITRRILRTSDGEERRPSTGPWPRWVEARGERPISDSI